MPRTGDPLSLVFKVDRLRAQWKANSPSEERHRSSLADELIPPNGTLHYYKRVMQLDEHVADFYRFFEAPGVQHCSGGAGPMPDRDETLQVLMRWVENGTVPETLTAKSQSGHGTIRDLCLWPKQQVYVGGDPKKRESFKCD